MSFFTHNFDSFECIIVMSTSLNFFYVVINIISFGKLMCAKPFSFSHWKEPSVNMFIQINLLPVTKLINTPIHKVVFKWFAGFIYKEITFLWSLWMIV